MPCLSFVTRALFLSVLDSGSSISSQFFVVWSRLKQSAQCSRGIAFAKAMAHADRSTSPHFCNGWQAIRLQKVRSYCIHSSPSNLRAACTMRDEYASRSGIRAGYWVAMIAMYELKIRPTVEYW